ncbi:MAG: DUF6677 family protein [Pirellulaceae bacterium]
MSTLVRSPDPEYPVEIDLRNRTLAAVWAWLWPGAGHIYQRRYAKGILFMVCILGTYFFGFGMGGWRVVYASFRRPDLRLPYVCQVAVGLPALPALLERQRALSDPPKPPLFGSPESFQAGEVADSIYRPPFDSRHAYLEQGYDKAAEWHDRLKGRFDIGTLYTMIAGLLNVLAIYDAYAGPAFILPGKEHSPKDDKKE